MVQQRKALTMFCSQVNVWATSKAQVLAENVSWFKVCTPDNISTLALIEQFIAFVDANPKYTLASTAVQMMLAQNYGCKK
jgi:hypothetical protein